VDWFGDETFIKFKSNCNCNIFGKCQVAFMMFLLQDKISEWVLVVAKSLFDLVRSSLFERVHCTTDQE